MQWVQGIGSAQAAAPQARLMATVISGILNQRLPWRLVFLGVFLVIAIELLGMRSLPFAVGTYISIATTMAMFAGGLVRWLAERGQEEKSRRRKRSQPRLALRQRTDRRRRRLRPSRYHSESACRIPNSASIVPGWLTIIFRLPWPPKMFAFGERFLPHLSQLNILGVILFFLLAVSLYVSARKRLN